MDKNFLMLFILLTILVSITVYVDESEIPNHNDRVEAKFFNLGEQSSIKQTQKIRVMSMLF
jgi:hypothetical protein